jgi:hypothetical protein
MVEVRHRLRLNFETAHIGGGKPTGQDHLERDEAIQADLPGLVDNTMPPRAISSSDS